MTPALRPSRAALSALLAIALVSTGCTTLRRVIGFKKQAEEARAVVRISGRIETEGPSQGTLVVILGRLVPKSAPEPGELATEGPGEELVGVDSYVRGNPGTYAFVVGPGRYQLGAYEDRNQNGLLEPDERAVRVRDGKVLDLGPGDRAHYDLRLAIGETLEGQITEPVDVLAIVERTPAEQREFSLWALSVQGEVCEDLNDPRFGPDAGPRGLWQPIDALNEGTAGIYFMEPYDRRRIPVLFVHGIAGYPQQFETLIDSLDRERFQAWFYFYPSGFGLDAISTHLAELLTRLQVKYDFDQLAIVAHSMGGLVSRGAILKYARETKRDDIELFITISTPWGGDVRAKHTEDAPIELPASFKDMDPSSDYLRWLFFQDDARKVPRTLPEQVQYHMIFGYGGSGEPYNDGTVTIASEANPWLQEQARSVRVWDYTHTGILKSHEAVERVDRLLSRRF